MNPIIQRELVSTLRTKRALVIQVLLVSALALLVVLRWPSDAMVNRTGEQSGQVLSIFAYGLMVGLMMMVPAFPATSIVSERQKGTLELLLNSPMSALSIMIGKIIGVSGFALILIVLSLPAAAACYTMGGVDQAQLLKMYAILVFMALQYASLGLLISTFAATTDAALRMTYGAILVLAVVTLGPHEFLQRLVSGSAATVIEWVRCVSPIPAMMETLGHEAVGSRGFVQAGGATGRFVILALILSALLLIWTTVRLSQRLMDRPRAAGKITDERSRGVQAYRRIMYLWFFDPKRRSELISPLANPVTVKEFRTRRFGRSNWMMRLVFGCMIISLALMLAATRNTEAWGVESLGTIMVLLSIGLIILVTPSLASGLISGERETGGWQLLQMTPLTAFKIVRGKLMSVMWTLVLLLFATLPAYGLLDQIDVSHKLRIRDTLISLVLTALFALLLSGAVSSLFKRTAAATTTAYMLLISLCAGTMLFWLLEESPFSRSTVETVLLFNPLAAALTLIKAPGFTEYTLIPGNWSILGIGSVILLVVLVVRTWRLTRPL